MCSEHIQGDEWGTYVALERSAPPERGMAYRARAPRSRSPRSSLGWGKPTTWRRGTGRRHGKGGRVRDAQEPEPQYMPSTGELIDIERVTISSEGGRWKSTHRGNSLAAYPTSSPVLEQRWAGRLTHRLSQIERNFLLCILHVMNCHVRYLRLSHFVGRARGF